MGVSFLDYPTRELEPGIYSLHSAAHVPVVFKARRFDHPIQTVTTADAGAAIILEFFAAPAIPFLVGETIFFQALTLNPYASVGTVLDVPDATHIKVNIPYNGIATGYINCDEHFVNWYLQFKIEKLNPDTLAVVSTIAEPIYRPEPDGTIRADISAYLRPQGAMDNPFSYSGLVNDKDLQAGGCYKVSYRYAYIGGITNYSVGNNRAYWVNAAKQILDPFSGNMADHVLQIYNTTIHPDKVKFMTEFPKPTYFPGFPFDFSICYWDETPDAADAAEVTRVREFFDINKVSTGLSYHALDKTKKNNVNRILLTDPTLVIADAIPAGTKYIDFWLDDGLGLNPPPDTTVCTVGENLLNDDDYHYHSVERGVQVGAYFQITLFEVNGIDVLLGASPISWILSPGDIHTQLGLNGSVQFRNLIDLANALVDPAVLKFFDDFAVVWKGPSCLSFRIEVYYINSWFADATFMYDDAGYHYSPLLGPAVPYICTP